MFPHEKLSPLENLLLKMLQYIQCNLEINITINSSTTLGTNSTQIELHIYSICKIKNS